MSDNPIVSFVYRFVASDDSRYEHYWHWYLDMPISDLISHWNEIYEQRDGMVKLQSIRACSPGGILGDQWIDVWPIDKRTA